MAARTFSEAISDFGAAVKAKLSNPAASGQPEDQLRNPLENLLHDLAGIAAPLAMPIHLVGESALAHLKTRPDFAVSSKNLLVGHIEVKAPGKGADPRKFPKDSHDAKQWEKLKSLPNLIYTDGNSFSLWRDGKLQDKIVTLDGNIESAGNKLKAPDILLALVSDFLQWQPIPPRSAKQLAEIAARLCRLMRDEVVEQVQLSNAGLTGLAKDWRKLLFPEANDDQFADGYAQAVTFGLLVARARGIDLKKGIEPAAQELRKSNSLIGAALRILTDDAENQKALQTSLGTLLRVLAEVDWPTVTKDKPEAWLYFYEEFLEVYDNALRKRTGSYYTPPEVVGAMTRLVDEALRGPLFERPLGFASPDVTIADPAAGTGTFILGVLRRIASTVEEDKGAGAVRAAIQAAAQRVIGFEYQFGPFAVAQLRIIAEMQSLMKSAKESSPAIPDPRLYITDTLGNPFVEEEYLPQTVKDIAKSRQAANKIKREDRITVVIGNPPYKNQAAGKGGWIEKGSEGRPAPMEWWQPPPEWGLGAHAHHLKNLYIYFWRWATLKVFGSGWEEATGTPVGDDRYGIVCFITVAGFLNGPGFQKMREDLRRTCGDIWVIDCSPEGHQPDIPTRIFQGVQQPVCIVLAARRKEKDSDVPARLRLAVLPKGVRQIKFEALAKLSLASSDWQPGASGWRDPFLPEQVGAWATFPALSDMFAWSMPGLKTHRTWVIAPDTPSLENRWLALQRETVPTKKEELFHSDPEPKEKKEDTKPKREVRARYLGKVVSEPLGVFETRPISVERDKGDLVPPIRYAFRSFDRQWLPPDNRLLSRPRPKLWANLSGRQVHITALEASSPKSGPAITLTDLIPDHDHYKGSFGGRVYPLWLYRQRTDKQGKTKIVEESNIKPEILARLTKAYGRDVVAGDAMAYIAAMMAHPTFTARFQGDLVRPGLRVPFTAEKNLFDEAVELGHQVIWLHCYGERFADPDAGRPKKPPRLPKGQAPTIPTEGEIPGAPEPLPDSMEYDAANKRLRIGKGYVENVTPEMWAYEVSGKQVLWHWFSYRKRDRSRPIIGDRRPPSPLEKIQPENWPSEYTDDLIDLLNVLGRLIALEPAQADLLDRICSGKLLDAAFFAADSAGDNP